MKREIEILEEYIKEKSMRKTSQRENILNVFLSIEKHVSVEELHKIVAREYPDIGYTTVYRAMRLFSQLGLCREVDLGDGIIRYEHEYAHEHHDHLICTECGELIEVFEPEIERMQDKMAKKHGFVPHRHKMEIFGTCRKCSSSKGQMRK